MKKLILLASAVLATSALAFENITVVNEPLGTGGPSSVTVGEAQADYISGGIPNIIDGGGYYHVPQYLPFYPTAAIIWPRVVEVDCVDGVSGIECNGFNWLPAMGRGEYLFIVPKFKAPGTTVVIKSPPVVIYKEVRRKPKGE